METSEKVVRSVESRERDRELGRVRSKRSLKVYFASVEEKERLELMAAKAGYLSVSAWLLQMVMNATGGSLYPPEYVEGLKTEVERLRRWLESAREESDDYKQQVKRLQSQRDSLLLLVHGLPNGADVVARFLQQAAGAQP
jgi:hypothetical protein